MFMCVLWAAAAQPARPAARPEHQFGPWARTKLVCKGQVQQQRARRARQPGHPHVGRLHVQVAQAAAVHLAQRLRAAPRPAAHAAPRECLLAAQVSAAMP